MIETLASNLATNPTFASLMESGFISFQPLIAQQVNIQNGPGMLLALCLVGAGAGLYLLRSVRPELARDYDIFFSAIGLLCGGILLFSGWRLDPILMFGQVLLTGSAIFFGFENIRMRSISTGQARRGTRSIDDDRPVSSERVYRAELDELGSYPDDRPPMRRIRGGRDSESERNGAYEDDLYSDSDRLIEGTRSRSPRRSNSRGGYGDRPNRSENSRAENNRRRSPSRGYDASFGDSASDSSSDYASESSYSTQSRRRPSTNRDSNRDESDRGYRDRSYSDRSTSNRMYDDEPPAPPRRRRDASSSDSSATYSKDDYVDYKPINSYSDDYNSRYKGSDYDDEWGAS
jgi:hypothetical protein